MIGKIVRVIHCINFPDLNDRTGIIERQDVYDDGTIEYLIRFSRQGSDWDWVKSDEIEAACAY